MTRGDGLNPQDVFGSWILLHRGKPRHWVCLCTECDKKFEVNTYSLKAGKSTKCIICAKKPRIKYYTFQIGDKVGHFTIKDDLGIVHQSGQMYSVQCECGETKKVRAFYLEKTAVPGCVTCTRANRKVDNISVVPAWFWNRIQTNAELRNHEFTITRQYLEQLWYQQKGKCALTGLDLTLKGQIKDCTGSVDRIDSSKPYHSGNLQWVHKDVNKMKNNFDQEYFLMMCRLITERTGSM